MSKQEAFKGVSVGEILAGKYRVEKILGMGGMGVVVAPTSLPAQNIVDKPQILKRPPAASSDESTVLPASSAETKAPVHVPAKPETKPENPSDVEDLFLRRE